MKVLVVDDSVEVRTRLVLLLGEIEGVDEVLEADELGDALAAARAAGPRVIVLDLNLRGASGLTIVPMLKREHPRTIVVIFTNHASEANRRRCVSSGADFFFDKSSDFERVVELVRGVGRDLADPASS